MCREIVFDASFAMFCGSDGKSSFEESKIFYQLFAAFDKDSALLVDRIPIHLLPKTKRARKEILKQFMSVDWRSRNDVSELVRGIHRINKENCKRKAENNVRKKTCLILKGAKKTSPLRY